MTDADVDGSHIRTLLLTFLFRHMRPLVEEGRVYVALPPLYQVKKGKNLEYLLDDRLLNQKLAKLGLGGAALIVRADDGTEREIEGADLDALVAQLDALEIQTRVLARRGLDFKTLLLNERHPKLGLPKMLVYVYRPDQEAPEKVHLYNEAGLKELQRREAGKHGDVEVMEAQHILLAEAENGHGEGEANLPPHRLVRYPLAECRVLDEIITRIESFGLGVEDFFLKREELVTGDLPPARFVLRAAEEKRIELDNLLEVAPGIRNVGREGLSIKRFKGLGEMNADELWDTTMDRSNRTLRRVVISEDDTDLEQADLDAREADRIFRLLMGENVEQRRRFIEENATNVKNLDV